MNDTTREKIAEALDFLSSNKVVEVREIITRTGAGSLHRMAVADRKTWEYIKSLEERGGTSEN